MTNFDDSSNPELPSIEFQWRDDDFAIVSFKLPCGDATNVQEFSVAMTGLTLLRSLAVISEAVILHTPFERVIYSIMGDRVPFEHIPMILNDDRVTLEDFFKYVEDNTIVREFGNVVSNFTIPPRIIQVSSIIVLIGRGQYCNGSDWPTDKAEVVRRSHEAQLRAMHSN
jgi:hypothetical protein